MRHEEVGGEYEFTRKISNSFADSIMASSPTKVAMTTVKSCLFYAYTYSSYIFRPTVRWEMVATPEKVNRWRRSKLT